MKQLNRRAAEGKTSHHDGTEVLTETRTDEPMGIDPQLGPETLRREGAAEELRRLEWILSGKATPESPDGLRLQPYGDLTKLNTSRVLLDSVGKDVLAEVVGDYLDLLGTSAGVFEKNGDYALGIFTSGWCQFLNNASRELCGTDDNREALDCGRWHCHESCWREASRISIETAQPVDVKCRGGMHIYAAPIRAGGEVVGSMNFGYGDPPNDPQVLQEIAERYCVSVDELRELADSYVPRPRFIIEIAKRRLQTSARLIGAVVDRERVEETLHESRARHRSMIEDLPIGLFRKKPGMKGAFLLANHALVHMLGYESRNEFLQVDMSDFCESPDDWTELYDELMAQGRVITKDLLLKKKDGTLVWGTVTATAVCNPQNQVEHINGLIQDITERKLLENQLGQAQKLEAMGQLAAGIAHEINTPIQYVGDNTRFVQESLGELMGVLQEYHRLLDEADVGEEILGRFKAAAEKADLEYLLQEVPAAIQQSLEGVTRVVEIVRAMKEFSHPDTDEKVPTDLNKTIESTVTLARNEWKYVAEMETNLDPELPPVPVLIGDIKQVILNMIVNAAHAIGGVLEEGTEDKGTITVSTARDGDWAEVRIGDTGTGIPEGIRAKVFDLFFTTKEVGKGTGQGLAICRAVVVEKHGGTITFETEEGKGTTFIIRIPIHRNSSGQE